MQNKNISKAKMLEYINSSKVTLFKVPNMLYFSNVLIEDNLKFVLDKIKNTFNDCTLAIRSSAADEDSENNSIAGGYSSVLNVPVHDEKKIIDLLVKEQNLEIIDLKKIEITEEIKSVLPSNYIKVNFVAISKVEFINTLYSTFISN